MSTDTHVHSSKCTSPRHHGHHGSHAACYEAGLHDKSKVARERCRVGSYKCTAEPTVTVTMNVKSKISTVVHAPSEDGILCDKKIAASIEVSADDYPVTCKICIKKLA